MIYINSRRSKSSAGLPPMPASDGDNNPDQNGEILLNEITCPREIITYLKKMEPTCDVFLTNLPKAVTEIVVKNLFSSAGKVLKVKIIDDKKNENQKLCFVGFRTMDEALEAVRIADNSSAFGDPIRASISRKCLDGIDNPQNRSNNRGNDSYKGNDSYSRGNDSYSRGNDSYSKGNDSYSKGNDSYSKGNDSRPQLNNGETAPNNRVNNFGRGRGLQSKNFSGPPSFKNCEVKLNDIKLKTKELIDIEIVDLNRIDFILVRPLKSTENSKIEIVDLLAKTNESKHNLTSIDNPVVGDYYLAKWNEDDCYYRAELLEILKDGSFKVAFVDEGTSGDIVQDIKQIPCGALQQYPKQFLKVSLGCSDVEDLKNFVLQESNGKTIKIYWLGEYCDESVPIVNLFLNEDEITEKYIQLNKKQIRSKFSLSFDDLPVHSSGKHSQLKFVPSMYKSRNDFVLQFENSYSVNLKNKKSPSVLPTPGDICIYEKRSPNNTQLFRALIKRRQLFSFDIQLIDSWEKISNVNIDNLYMPENYHKNDFPYSICCEIDNTMSLEEEMILKILNDGEVVFSIDQYKKNNRYQVAFHLPEKKFFEYSKVSNDQYVGKSSKVTVSHFISPINFYIQFDEAESTLALGDIQEKLNMEYKGSYFKNIDDLKINQAVVAPFIVSGSDSELFRAKVLEKRKESPQVHVLFIDYGNDEWVNFDTLQNVDSDLVKKSGFAYHCQLNLNIRKEAWGHANELFSELIGYAENEQGGFVMEVSRLDGEKLVVDLISPMKGSITAILEKSGTCVSKSSEPLCNGDSRVSKLNGISHEPNSNNNYDNYSNKELSKKVEELERRLCALEILLKK